MFAFAIAYPFTGLVKQKVTKVGMKLSNICLVCYDTFVVDKLLFILCPLSYVSIVQVITMYLSLQEVHSVFYHAMLLHLKQLQPLQ